MPRWHFPVWKSMVAVALMAVALGLCVVPVARRSEWSRLERQMDASVRFLKPTDPNVNSVVWDCAHGWTVTAYGNVCCSGPDYTSTAEMYRLSDDLNRKLKGEINVETLVWIWDRLGKTGPNGKRYVERFRPMFEECFSQQAAIPSAPESP